MNSAPSEIVVPVESQTSTDGRPISEFSKWGLAALLGSAYVGVQLVLTLPVVAYAMFTQPRFSQNELLSDPLLIWTTVIVLGIAALVTILVAVSWPKLWRLIDPKSTASIDEWLGWRAPKLVPIWAVPVMTLPFMLIVLVGVSLTTDIAEIEIQAQMFSTLPLQITSFIIVSTVVPLAEEVIFRGALFNAVMRPSATGLRGLAVPVVVTSIAFAVLHVPSGFVMLGPILQITLLAFYLGVLRATTDSVIPSVVAHMTWNLVSATGYALANTVQVP